MKPRPMDLQGSSKGHYLCYSLFHWKVHKAREEYCSVFSQISLPLHIRPSQYCGRFLLTPPSMTCLWHCFLGQKMNIFPMRHWTESHLLSGQKNFIHKHTNEHIYTYTCIPTQIEFIYICVCIYICTGTFTCNICMHMFILHKYAYPPTCL